MKITIPISVGELLDKITILQIKVNKSDNHFIHKELNDLIKIATDNNVYKMEYIMQLLNVNKILWDVEDKIRVYEKRNDFSEKFIELARLVYITNDKRASIKKKINEETKSEYSEVKLHK